jgi:hypothetical protein
MSLIGRLFRGMVLIHLISLFFWNRPAHARAFTTIESRRMSILNNQNTIENSLCSNTWNNNILGIQKDLKNGASPFHHVCLSLHSSYDPYYSRKCTPIFYAVHALSYELLSLFLLHRKHHRNHNHHRSSRSLESNIIQNMYYDHIPSDNLGMTPLHYIVDPYIMMMHVHKCFLRGNHLPCTTLSSSIPMDITAAHILNKLIEDHNNDRNHYHHFNSANQSTYRKVSYSSFVKHWQHVALPIIDSLLRSYNGWDTAVDHYGQTILHRAAEGGVLAVVRRIYIQSPNLLNAIDRNGKTPLDKAFSKLHFNVVKWLFKHGGRSNQQINEINYLTNKRIAHLLPKIITHNISSHGSSWMQSVKHLYNKAVDSWTIDNMIQLKNFYIRPSSIPYPDIYGGFYYSEKIHFHRYIDSNIHGYVFERLAYDSPLWNALSSTKKYNDTYFQHLFPNQTITSIQFSFSKDNNTGSSWHYHTNSVTLLIKGEKKWNFLKPSKAQMSNYMNNFTTTTNGTTTYNNIISFVQKPGDLVYVPDRWSHRTYNTRANTMGLTFELQKNDGGAMEPIHIDYSENMENLCVR